MEWLLIDIKTCVVVRSTALLATVTAARPTSQAIFR
jgi:hypothetical protein